MQERKSWKYDLLILLVFLALIIRPFDHFYGFVTGFGIIAFGLFMRTYHKETSSDIHRLEVESFAAEKRAQDDRDAAMRHMRFPLNHANLYAMLAADDVRDYDNLAISTMFHDLRRFSVNQFLEAAVDWNLTENELFRVLAVSGVDTLALRDVIEERERDDSWPDPKPPWASALVKKVCGDRIETWTNEQTEAYNKSLQR